MSQDSGLVDAIMAAFRERLEGAMERLRSSEDALSFCDAEREMRALALELATEVTRRALQSMADDEARSRAALERVEEKARQRGIEMRRVGRRKTLVRTLSGQEVEVLVEYAVARPRGQGRKTRKRGPQGTGVYPVLDELGIVGRATPALRLLVARSVCEANSVAAARELLSMGGVEIGHKAALRLTYEVTSDALRARAEAVAALKKAVDAGPFAGRHIVATIDGGRLQVRRRERASMTLPLSCVRGQVFNSSTTCSASGTVRRPVLPFRWASFENGLIDRTYSAMASRHQWKRVRPRMSPFR